LWDHALGFQFDSFSITARPAQGPRDAGSQLLERVLDFRRGPYPWLAVASRKGRFGGHVDVRARLSEVSFADNGGQRSRKIAARIVEIFAIWPLASFAKNDARKSRKMPGSFECPLP